MKTWLTVLLFFTCLSGGLVAQRSYKNASVLSSGSWYKIAINAPGIYKVDIAVLNKLGITGQSFPSAAIRLYGNGGSMLPESCSATVTDDLVENAIQVVDGGDGVLNGGDYFLFYATGPHQWTPDSINKRFRHQFNLYSNHSYYYITISGSGKRVPAQPATQPANTVVTSFSERFFHELDSVNFLSSGKEWFGEELSGLPGKSLSASFPLPYTDVLPQPAVLVANCAARSIGASSRFQVNASNSQVLQLDINATTNTNTDIFANENQSFASFVPTAAPVVGFQFTAGGINAQGWINWFEVFCRRPLAQPSTSALSFRDWNSVAPGNIAEWRISNGAQAQVWDVTDPFNAVRMSASINGTTLSFTNEASRLREYVVFNNSFLNPEPIGPVPNQNLHASGTTDMIIIAFEATRTEASRLATFHQQKNGLRTVVVTAEQIYNEFSSGIPDPTALRDFAKMYFDKAGSDSVSRPDYLLLFGDASFDYKKRLTGNTNFVPAYQSANALDPLSTYTSDDFFGFLNDHEDINSAVVVNQLDLGIGRVPARNNAEARSFVNKVFAYHEPKSLGPWRNEHTFIADDEDFNLHLNDAEIITAAAATTNPLFIQEKIYLDAFNQESNTAGARYPEVNRAISNQVQAGTLIWNYSGHGGFRRLAEEVVLEQEIVNSWNNPDRLPLFITATCDFAPYDNPVLNSLGENILLREKTGAIALMTTTRLVFAFSNRIMNRNYLQFALQPAVDGNYLSLGDAIRKAKNFTYINQADIVNNRKFTLLGDPAMTLAFPKNKVETVAINGVPITSQADTLKALEKYNIDGQVTDNAGAVISGFNGTVYATVFDKPKAESTRANDPDSYKQDFQVQKNALFKGKVKVVAGKFTYSFVVPKDINYQPGAGKISYYADNGQSDGNGVFSGFYIGGSQGVSSDVMGPEIKSWLNDEKFVSGSIVGDQPMLLLKLSDSSGINIMGTGIGHDLSATIDGDASRVFVLNEFFETDLDTYQKGMVRFQLPEMGEGRHYITIKAWDVANNSSEMTIEFQIVRKEGLVLSHVVNYPNPFTTRTSFWFEHNRPNEDLRVTIQVFTIAGKLVKTLRQTINTSGNRSSDIEWNATDDYGDKLARGVYIYQMRVTTADGKSASKLEKLLLL